MRAKGIIVKNIAGGFLGGFLGILTFGYIYPNWIFLGCGCILGVVVGMKIAQPFVFLVTWMLGSPKAFCCWLKKHPMNQVFTIRFFAFVANAMLVTSGMGFLGVALVQMFGSDMEVFTLLLCVIVCPVIVLIPVWDWNESLKRLGYLRSSWMAYSRLGVARFFLKEFLDTTLIQIGLVGGSALFVVMGGVFVTFFIAPFSFVIGVVKGVYRMATKSGYWLCLVTTLLVTLLSAWKMHPHFVDPRMLWAVALATGVMSAAITEGLRRLVIVFYDQNEFIKQVALRKLKTQLAPSGKRFWGIYRACGR